MKREVRCVYPRDKVLKVVNLFSETGFSGFPVVREEDGVLVGVISESDVLRDMARVVEGRHDVTEELVGGMIWEIIEELDPKRFDEVVVEEIMTRDVLTVSPDADVFAVADIMAANNVNRIPVVDEERKVVGIITRRDLIAAMARRLTS